jgi:hypothetical protein
VIINANGIVFQLNEFFEIFINNIFFFDISNNETFLFEKMKYAFVDQIFSFPLPRFLTKKRKSG